MGHIKKNTLPSKSSAYIGSSVVFVALSLFSAALNYTYYPVIARFLSPAEFGATQSLLAVLLQIGAVFSGLNLVTIYLAHKLKPEEARNNIEILQRLTTTLFFIITLCITLFQSRVLNFLHIDNGMALFIVSLDLLSSIPFIISFGFLQARKRFVAAGLLQLSVVSTKLIMGGLAAKTFGVNGALAGILIGQILGMAIFWLVCQAKSIPAWEHKILRSLRPPTFANLSVLRQQGGSIAALFSVNVLLALFISIDIIASRHYFPSVLSGLYSGASTLSNAIVFVCLPLISVLLPHLNMQSLRKSAAPILRTSAMILLVSIGSVVVLRLLPETLLGIFGSEYKNMSYLLWRLGILMSLVSLLSLSLQVSAFYAPKRSALICLAGAAGLIAAIVSNHQSPTALVSTIMGVFATMLGLSCLHIFWIYSHEQYPQQS